MPTYLLQHLTRYNYEDLVSVCHHLAHLLPRDTPHHVWRSADLEITPLPAVRTERLDYFGNRATFFAIQEPHRELSVISQAQVELNPPAVATPLFASPPWEEVRDQIAASVFGLGGGEGGGMNRTAALLDAAQFTPRSPYVQWTPEIAAYAAQSFVPGRPIVEATLELVARIHDEFTYDPTSTTVTTTLPEIMATKAGVCQDFAHFLIGALRSLGLAARYVSGYLLTTPPPGKPRLVGTDASHAWASLFLPGHEGIGGGMGGGSWLDFDPTNNCVPHDRHITLAWGRDFGDVSPIRGVILGGGRHHQIQVNVDVAPVPNGTPNS